MPVLRRIHVPVLCALALLMSCLVSRSAADEAAAGLKPAPQEHVHAGDAKADAGHDGHGGEHDATGVPMNPVEHGPDLVIWTIVTFVVFLFVLKKAAWGPLIAGLDKREAHYAKLLADAQADRDRATKLLSEYEQKLKSAQQQVEAIIAEARRDADTTKADIVATAQREAETTRQRAIDDIARAKDQAVNELFSHVRANVIAATEKILARSLNDADHSRFIDEALAEVSAR